MERMWWDGCLSSDRHDGGSSQDKEGQQLSRPKDEESRTRENYTCAKLHCELMMKLVRKQTILFVKSTV